MATTTFTCSQCLFTGSAPIKFCPRCGLPANPEGEAPAPVRLRISEGEIVVHDLLAHGDLCNLYRCDLTGRGTRGVFKIARSARANAHVTREAATLLRLSQADTERRFLPFLPQLAGSLHYRQDESEPARAANVLTWFDGIAQPDELFSLEQVRTEYPQGIDERDMAWMWRRLLTILGFVHRQNVAHGVVTPDHVLIEPRGHKLVLIGWSAAIPFGLTPHLFPLRWRDWIPSSGTAARGSSAATDLGCAARTVSYLLGGGVEPAISRHLERAAESHDAWKLLEDFDKLIEALWGPRQFRAFAMPRPVERK